MQTPKKIGILSVFALVGAGYITAFSQVEIAPILKSYVIIVPLQVTALSYLFWLHFQQRLGKASKSPSAQDR